MSWNQAAYEAHQRKHGFVAAIAESKPVEPQPSQIHKAEVRVERDMHAQAINELRRRQIEFIHAPMHKRSTLPEGWPDFTIFLPNVQHTPPMVWFVEFKTPTGRLLPEQERRIASLRAGNWRVDVLRSVEAFIEALRAITNQATDPAHEAAV